MSYTYVTKGGHVYTRKTPKMFWCHRCEELKKRPSRKSKICADCNKTEGKG